MGFVVLTVLASLVRARASETLSIKVDSSCPSYTRDEVLNGQRRPFHVFVMMVGAECPVEQYGVLHRDMCQKCASEHRPDDGRFIFCIGCDADEFKYSKIDDVATFIRTNQVKAIDTEESTNSSGAIPLASAQTIAKDVKRANASSTEIYKDTCEVQDTSDPAGLEQISLKEVDCTLCTDVPIQLAKCCDNCFNLAKEQEDNIHIQTGHTFISCLGCDKAKHFKQYPHGGQAAKYGDRTKEINKIVEQQVNRLIQDSTAKLPTQRRMGWRFLLALTTVCTGFFCCCGFKDVKSTRRLSSTETRGKEHDCYAQAENLSANRSASRSASRSEPFMEFPQRTYRSEQFMEFPHRRYR